MKVDFRSSFSYIEGDNLDLIIKVPPRVRQATKVILDRNEAIQISVGDKRKPRTTGEKSQNHKLNGGIQFFCEQTGNDFQDVKDAVKWRAIKRGYPFKRNVKTGEILLSVKTGEPIPESEANISTVECGYLIDELYILAGENNIILPESYE